jgi:hypothetical protein
MEKVADGKLVTTNVLLLGQDSVINLEHGAQLRTQFFTYFLVWNVIVVTISAVSDGGISAYLLNTVCLIKVLAGLSKF